MESNNDNPQNPVTEPRAPRSTIEMPSSAVLNSAPLAAGAEPTKKRFAKVSIIPSVLVAAAVLIGGSAAGYFGLVLPNQPENIWKTALDNTAQGYDRLVEYGEKQKDTKGGTVTGTFKVENADFVTDGNIDGKFDATNSNTTIDAGLAGTRLRLNVLTNIPQGASTPDTYLKAEGLEGLANLVGGGDPQAAQMLSGINNQYYFIDHTLFEQLQKQTSDSSTTMELSDLKAEDIIDFMRQFGEVNKEYVFTSDSAKAIFTVKEELGKETLDGREAYHFEVALDKENVKSWNQAVCDRLANHKVVKTLSNATTDEDRKKECEDTSDYEGIDENQTADVWVDMKTKLIRTVRMTEKDGAQVYNFGLLYDDGDEYPFYLDVKDDEQGDMKVTTTLNTKTNVVSFVVSAAIKNDDQTGNVDLDLVFTPSNDTVQFTKPEGVKPLNELLAPFLAGFSGSTPLELPEESLNDIGVE